MEGKVWAVAFDNSPSNNGKASRARRLPAEGRREMFCDEFIIILIILLKNLTG
jgi:hypothetical protein